MAREERVEIERSIRLATSSDAYQLAAIKRAARSGDRPGADGPDPGTPPAELDFLDRLALPHGDDYFCVVAEEAGRVVGYLIGGGSRDLDRKAHGEIYEIAVLPAFRRRGVARALLADALGRFDAAAFAGTLLSAAADDVVVRRLAIGLLMQPDSYRDDDHTIIRYERTLRRPTRIRSDS
jgi:ribosomal protein S18 acetylase RimI-like enzyme